MATKNIKINHVFILKEPNNKRFLLLLADYCSLGRNSDNDIIIKERQVSRYHAIIFKKKLKNSTEQIWIYDGNLKRNKRSSNGLRIKHQFYNSYCLKTGDSVLIGHNVTLQYYQFTEQTLALLNVIKIGEKQSESDYLASNKRFQKETSILIKTVP